MTFDPAFRFHRHDPQRRPVDALTARFSEIVVEVEDELARRRELYPWLARKGRMTEAEERREVRIWAAIADDVAFAGNYPWARATWTERLHALRREIAIRRATYPAMIADGRLTQDEAERRLTLLELLHDLDWNHTHHDEAIAARATTEPRAAA